MVEYQFVYQRVPNGDFHKLDGATIDNEARISIFPAGGIENVRFFVDGVFTHKDLGAPFSLNGDSGWPPVSNPNKLSPGPHYLKAVLNMQRGRNLTVVARCSVGTTVDARVSVDTLQVSVSEIASVVKTGTAKFVNINETLVIFSSMTSVRRRNFVRDISDSLSLTDTGMNINFTEIVSPQIIRVRNDAVSLSDAGQKILVSDTQAKNDLVGLNDKNITIDYYTVASLTPIYDQLVLDYSI